MSASKVRNTSCRIGIPSTVSIFIRQRQCTVSSSQVLPLLSFNMVLNVRLVFSSSFLQSAETLNLWNKYEAAVKKEGRQSDNMEAVNEATNESLARYLGGIEDATEETLAGYIVGFYKHKTKWYISPHRDKVEEIRNAIQNRLWSRDWKDQGKFFDHQGVNWNLLNEWRNTAKDFTELQEASSTFLGDSESFRSLTSSLRPGSSNCDGSLLTVRSTGAEEQADRATETCGLDNQLGNLILLKIVDYDNG
jgi:hypothetical protein